MAWLIRVDFNVTVAAGQGVTTFYSTSKIDQISFIPPSGTPTFDYEITDEDGHGVDGRNGLVAQTTIELRKTVVGKNFLSITNAAVDGVWNIRMWVDVQDKT